MSSSISNVNISVVIATRNRASDLQKCIYSLLNQTQKIDNIVIIDNNSSDNTQKIVENFRKNNKNISYITELKVGFKYPRNTAINNLNCDWIAFIDDDCVAEKKWYENLVMATTLHKDTSAILGDCKTYYKQNNFSLLTNFIHNLWKYNAIQGENIIDLEVLDSKNIIFNRQFLKKNKIKNQLNHPSHDCDLGMQIQSKEGKSVFKKDIVIYHKDPDNFISYYKKIRSHTLGHLKYERKWGNYRKVKFKDKSRIKMLKNFIIFYFLYIKQNKIRYIDQLIILINLFFTIIYRSLIRIFNNISFNRFQNNVD